MRQYLAITGYNLILILLIVAFSQQNLFAQSTRIPRNDGTISSQDFVEGSKQFQGTEPLQVFIELNIFEVIIRNTDDIGFIYDIVGELGEIDGTDLAGNETTESNLSVLGQGSRDNLLPAGANVVAEVFEDDDGKIEATIQALAEDQILKIHANPILLTVEGIPARLETGEDVPFLERVNLGNIETVASRYRQTGVTLQITPWVGYMETDVQKTNPYILTDIQADLSAVTRFREENGFTQPIIDTRKYETNLWLKSGNRIIIGSIFRDSLSNRERGIPILRDLPLLGRLFRSSSTTNQVSQLYIIIRPVLFNIWGDDSIINQEQEFRRNYQQLQERLENQTQDAELEVNPFNEFRELLIDRSSPN